MFFNAISDEHSLCQLSDKKFVYIDNRCGSLLNRENIQFGQVLVALRSYHNVVINNVLTIGKQLYDCTQRTSNKIMRNLTNITVTQDEMRFGLKHGVVPRSKNLK